jgi:hypothetical protein
MQQIDDLNPPRPRACLRIGVTGHRIGAKLSEGQVAGVRATIDTLLSELRTLGTAAVMRDAWAFDEQKLALSVVSPLAEGADRIVAEAGLAAGMSLRVILPFCRDDYRTDFESQTSKEAFDALMGRAEAVMELDGKRDAAARAYEAAGLLMLANTDIVITIWDQAPADGIGGTALIVERAIADGVPVILVDPARPGTPSILWRKDTVLPAARAGVESLARRPIEETLGDVVSLILAPPTDPTQRNALKMLYAEREHNWNIGISYPVLLFLLGLRPLRWSDLRTPTRKPDAAKRWRDYLLGHLNDEALRPLDTDTLFNAYSFLDHLSVRYAQIYRSAYVFNFAASAFAVLLALLGVLMSLEVKAWLVACEIAIILSILLVLRAGGKRQWHRRWLEYRRLAETLRHIRLLAPTASAARLERPGNRAGRVYGWVSWYARAVEREVPIPNIATNEDYLAAIRDAVRTAEIEGQIAYNLRNAHVMHEAGERLHIAGTILFGATLVICVAFLIVYIMDPHHEIAEKTREWAVFLTALLPAVGAAISGIRAQADFQTVADRSSETARNLIALDKALADEKLQFALLSDRIEKVVDVLMADNTEWHVMFSTRPLSLPA